MDVCGSFVISLDFELLWGVRDKRTVADYGANILGARHAIPAMLDLFASREVSCTWATVGLLFCADKTELIDSFPRLRPNYREASLSPYADLADLGRDEESDPYRYGLSLLKHIAARPRQEIATHTFSHFYCLEEGGSIECFRSDLDAARAVAGRHGIKLTSIVFPRNQISLRHLRVCREAGLTAFRGNEHAWFHAARRDSEQTRSMRAARLADSYLSFVGPQVHCPTIIEGMVDVPSSRFLRPARGRGILEKLRLRRITSAMTAAARRGKIFHLWWHPHNFGLDIATNLAFLSSILDHFGTLHRRYGMRSMTMADVAAETLNGPRGSAHI
jgi:hypothetical protein